MAAEEATGDEVGIVVDGEGGEATGGREVSRKMAWPMDNKLQRLYPYLIEQDDGVVVRIHKNMKEAEPLEAVYPVCLRTLATLLCLGSKRHHTGAKVRSLVAD